MPFALVLIALFVVVVFSLWTAVVLALVGRRAPAACLLTLASSAFGSFVALLPFFPTYLMSQVPDESEER